LEAADEAECDEWLQVKDKGVSCIFN
jgi:hypothetical protein